MGAYKFHNRKLQTGGVRSPRKGHTIEQLKRLRQDNWANPDTGTEISEEEGEDYLMRMQQRQADRSVAASIGRMARHSGRTRSGGRPWIPRDQVMFRNINGHAVPFRKTFEPSL